MSPVEIDDKAVRWDRAIWPEGDVEGSPIVFLFEFNRAGEVLRQVELAGENRVPIAAASAAEWWQAQEATQQPATSALLAYEAMYGSVAEGSVNDWDPDYPGEPISGEEFEAEWRRAREHLDSTRGLQGGEH